MNFDKERTLQKTPSSSLTSSPEQTLEYVVVLKSEEDKISFISEPNVLTSQSQSLRQGRVLRCSLARNTIETIQNDPRVESIEPYIKCEVVPMGFPSHQPPIKPIGSDEQTPTPETQIQALDNTKTITNLPDGFSTDVVIVDGIADPNHPEFAKNANGTGGSRLSLIDWYAYVDSLLSNSTKLQFGNNYPYTLIRDPDSPEDNHGSHVMGTVCGNTQGWAAKANIYNITPYIPQIMFDQNNKDLYLQALKIWHQNKPANPLCGTKNPTITNHSYGVRYSWPKDIRDILSVTYRGQTYTPQRNYSGAQCSASISSGSISSIAVTNEGSNYTNPPTVSFYGGGQATAVAELASGSVYKITITDGGSGYTKNNPPTVTFSAPPAGGVRATGSVVSNRFLNNATQLPEVYINETGNEFPQIGPAGTGQVYYVEITEAGSGYVSPPTVTFSTPPGGRAAQATTEIRSGFIKRIRITNGGTGYENSLATPYVILSGGNPTESADISIGPVLGNYTTPSGSLIDGIWQPYIGWRYQNLTMEIYFAGGGNYQSQPIVSFYGGNYYDENMNLVANKPEAHAVLGTGANAGKVVSIVVDIQGAGYTSPPTVVLTNGGGFTVNELRNFGQVVYSWPESPGQNFLYAIPARSQQMDEDIASLISAGVIVVAAAGNDYYKIDIPEGQDYNNSVRFIENPRMKAESSILTALEYAVDLHYHRGPSPGSAPGVICVGAVGVGSPEYKTDFSNTGPRVDIYAPGHYINSSVYPSIEFVPHGVADPRNANYSLTKWSGTSMASPQVAGMLACYARSNRNIDQNSARDFIINNAKPTLNDGTGYESLQGGSNRYAFMPNVNTN